MRQETDHSKCFHTPCSSLCLQHDPISTRRSLIKRKTKDLESLRVCCPFYYIKNFGNPPDGIKGWNKSLVEKLPILEKVRFVRKDSCSFWLGLRCPFWVTRGLSPLPQSFPSWLQWIRFRGENYKSSRHDFLDVPLPSELWQFYWNTQDRGRKR